MPKATILILIVLVASPRPPHAMASITPLRGGPATESSHAAPRATLEIALPSSSVIEESIEAIRQRLGVPGMAVSLTVGDMIVFEGGFGVCELGQPDPVTAHTPFAIASTTKAFTALAISLLVEEGRLHWSDRLADRLDGLDARQSGLLGAATISNAAAHRTGLNPGGLLGLSSGLSRRDIVSKMIELDHTDFEAGQFAYNNIVYSALGLVIGDTTGSTWEQAVTAGILRPLGMTESACSDEMMNNDRPHATAHVSRDGGWTPKPPSQGDLGPLRPAGGIISTAHDLALFTRALVGGGDQDEVRRIDPDVFQATTRPQSILGASPQGWLGGSFPECNTFSYGRGWFMAEVAGSRVVFHPGGGGGMSAMVMLVPEHQIGITVLSNDNDYAALFATTNTLIDMVLDRPIYDWVDHLRYQQTDHEDTARGQAGILAKRPTQPLPPLELERYVGRYEHALYGGMDITLEGGSLMIHRGGLVGTLDPWDRDSFLVTYPSSTFLYDIVSFRIDSNRTAVEFVFFDESGFHRVGNSGHGH